MQKPEFAECLLMRQPAPSHMSEPRPTPRHEGYLDGKAIIVYGRNERSTVDQLRQHLRKQPTYALLRQTALGLETSPRAPRVALQMRTYTSGGKVRHGAQRSLRTCLDGESRLNRAIGVSHFALA